MFTLRLRAFLLVLICLGCGAACRPQSLQNGPALRIDSVDIDANSTVRLSVKPLGESRYDSMKMDTLLDVQTGSAYRAVLDQTSMAIDPASHQFHFRVYLNKATLFQTSVYGYEVSENPRGAFNDTLRSLVLHIGADDPAGPRSLVEDVPMHSPYGPSAPLDLGDVQTMQRLNTGSRKSFTVHFTSKLGRLSAALGNATATATCDRCLKSLQVHLSTQQLLPSGGVDVAVEVEPNLWQAMSTSSHPEAADRDTTINLVVPFTAEGGNTWTQPIAVPVRFWPAPSIIASSVIAGVLIGALVRGLLLFFSSKAWSWPEFVTGVITATLCWLIAMLLWKGDTSVRLLGVTFVPTEFLSALVLCILAGGGPALITLLKPYFPQIGAPQASANTGTVPNTTFPHPATQNPAKPGTTRYGQEGG